MARPIQEANRTIDEKRHNDWLQLEKAIEIDFIGSLIGSNG
jgi:hypothetical protein